MSYDLYFTSPAISYPEFQQYFERRPRYRLEGKTARYWNDDTGVYFSFDYNDRDEEEVSDQNGPACPVMFGISYVRPSYFVLEAELEVSAFVRHFGCQIDDPQTSIEGDYRAEDFIAGWNHGNHRNYRTMLMLRTESDPPVYSLPKQRQEDIWRWNYTCSARSGAEVENRFISPIFVVEYEGELVSFCVWYDAIPSILPEVDRLWIARSRLAPKPLFRERKDDHCFVPLESMRGLLEPYQVTGPGLREYHLPLAMPAAIIEHVRKLPPMRGEAKRVGTDQILTQELMM